MPEELEEALRRLERIGQLQVRRASQAVDDLRLSRAPKLGVPLLIV